MTPRPALREVKPPDPPKKKGARLRWKVQCSIEGTWLTDAKGRTWHGTPQAANDVFVEHALKRHQVLASARVIIRRKVTEEVEVVE